MKKKIKKLKLILGSFFLSLAINSSSVKAIEKKSENEIVKSSEKLKKKLVIENNILKEVDQDYQIKKYPSKPIGGVLTGTTYEKYQKNTLIWLDEYGKKNKLILPKVQISKIIPLIPSIENSNYVEQKNNNKKTMKFKKLFFEEINKRIIINYDNSKK